MKHDTPNGTEIFWSDDPQAENRLTVNTWLGYSAEYAEAKLESGYVFEVDPEKRTITLIQLNMKRYSGTWDSIIPNRRWISDHVARVARKAAAERFHSPYFQLKSIFGLC